MSAANQSSHPLRPREQLPITLFDGVVLAVRDDQGRIYLGLRDLCGVLDLNHSAQRRRILLDEALHLAAFRVQAGGQFRTLDFLLLDDVPVWLLGVQAGRISAPAQERFGYVKQYLVSAVQRAFAALTGLPDAPSSAIEDLTELDRIEQAFVQLADLGRRQDSLETSQERARQAFREVQMLLTDLRDRLHAVEHRVGGRLTPVQRGAIYQMVQQWGTARAAHDSTVSVGVALRRSWAEVNAAFGVSTYTDLPVARYDAIVRYVQDRYHALTGRALEVVEQIGLEGLADG